MKEKVSKSEANYKNFHFTKNCVYCSMFVNPNACTLVKGTIAKVGTCKYWEKKKGLPVEN